MYVGTSGYTYPFWGPPSKCENVVLNYYRTTNKKKWLYIYASEFNSVEINMTRYRKLTPKICQNWVDDLFDISNFKFTIKAPTYITHAKKLNDFDVWWKEFEECLKVLGDRLGAILFQFHPSFKCTNLNIKKLENVKKIIPKKYIVAFEFRDKGWYSHDSEIEKLFNKNWIFVDLHVPEVRDQKFNFGNLEGGMHYSPYKCKQRYYRLHGTWGYSCGTYGEKMLKYILIDPMFIYFNNTDTWEYEDTKNVYGVMCRFTPVGKSFVPSAIYDVRCVKYMFDFELDTDGYVVLEFLY